MRTGATEILLAEDNPSDAELILEALSEIVDVARVHRVHDGVEALDHLFGRGVDASRSGSRPISLVLLDIKLPKVEGLGVLAEIRRDPRTRCVPVVMLTSSRMDADVRAAYELGANGYVQKPVDFAEFREVVRCLGRFWIEINEGPPVYMPEPAS